jgi:hypothetical protein
MYSNAKANALIRDLSDRLSVRLPASNAGLNSIRQAYYVDANNASWPILVLSHNGNEAEGQPVLLIEISNVDMISKDIFGNQTYAYAPHLLQFGYELSSGAAPLPARADLALAQFEAQTCGCEWQLKEVANGTAVSGASVNAAAAVVDIQPLYWPTKSV